MGNHDPYSDPACGGDYRGGSRLPRLFQQPASYLATWIRARKFCRQFLTRVLIRRLASLCLPSPWSEGGFGHVEHYTFFDADLRYGVTSGY
jgi:hypothetical protein